MPSSIASLASGGGASAAAVAEQQRRRTSAPTRAAVGAQQHEQAAQLAPASARRAPAADDLVAGATSQARPPALARLAGEEDLVRQALARRSRAYSGDCGRAARSCVPRAATLAAPRARRCRRPARSSRAGARSRTSCGPAITSRSAALIACSVEASTERGGVVEDRGCAGRRAARARSRCRWRWPPRQRQPALADARVVAVGQLGDEAGRLRALGRQLDLLARSRPAAP